MRELILRQLSQIEKDYSVKILLAVESGSRAWGFASPDSDYDVRFIYLRSKEDYLRLDEVRDVIEVPINGELDINGWDLKKTLQLLYRSNPTLFEWFSSPVVYMETPFANQFREIMNDYFSKKKSIYHYISMAEGNYRDYLKRDMVKAKKYFYVLRPVLACRWVLDRNTPPPMLFSELASEELPERFCPEVNRLLDLKINSPEIKEIPRIDILNEYLDKSIDEIKNVVASSNEGQNNDWARLNKLFLQTLSLEQQTD